MCGYKLQFVTNWLSLIYQNFDESANHFLTHFSRRKNKKKSLMKPQQLMPFIIKRKEKEKMLEPFKI